MYSFDVKVLCKKEPEEETDPVRKNQSPGSAKSRQNKEDEPAGEDLVPIIQAMPYRQFKIKIYKHQGQTSQYFYDPVLLLDPTKVQSRVNKATGKAYVCFPVQMWDEEIERQVAAFLKKLPGCRIGEELRVQVMPFDELKLVTRGDLEASGSYHPSINGTSYHQLDQRIQFHLFCETTEAADSLVESFRMDPDFCIQDLTLECIKREITGESKRKRLRSSVGSSCSASDDVTQSYKYLMLNIDSSIKP